jgi:hypothetical protein
MWYLWCKLGRVFSKKFSFLATVDGLHFTSNCPSTDATNRFTQLIAGSLRGSAELIMCCQRLWQQLCCMWGSWVRYRVKGEYLHTYTCTMCTPLYRGYLSMHHTHSCTMCTPLYHGYLSMHHTHTHTPVLCAPPCTAAICLCTKRSKCPPVITGNIAL